MKNKAIPQHIRRFLKRMYADYGNSLELPQPYEYVYGNPIRPIVPLDIARDGVFIIGAYPTAKFATIDGLQNVPVADINGPFSDERYFDGSRIRPVASGEELDTEYLTPLDLNREHCWITNLVKVFLFKQGHIKKCRQLDCEWPQRPIESEFEKYARQGLDWLKDEIELARPRVIITLGRDTAGILQNVTGPKKRNTLLSGDVKTLHIADIEYPIIHLAHPGIIMRRQKNNPWPKRHEEEHLPAARKNIADLLA